MIALNITLITVVNKLETKHDEIICKFSFVTLKLKKVASLIEGVWYKILYHHTVAIKEWHEVAWNVQCLTTFSWRHSIGMQEKTSHCKQHKVFSVHSIGRLMYHEFRHIPISKDIVSIFPATVWSSTFLQKKCSGKII